MNSRVITEIMWNPSQGFDSRAETIFSDSTKIRLDPADYKIKLTLQSTNWKYPTDTNLNVRTRTYNPEAVKQLLILQVNSTIPTDIDGDDLAIIGLRIFNGTNEMWWTGASWAIAGASDWNTETEINENIDTFDVTDRKFGIVINLQTLDDNVTPTVESVYVLWQGEIDWSQDIILDSLTRSVQEEAIYVDDVGLPPVPGDTVEIDLSTYTDESNLNIVDVEAVYEHKTDPYHRINLLDSYDTGTKIITLNSTMLADGVPYIRLNVLAQVAWDTHQDFTEVGNLPQVVLSDTRTINSSQYPFGDSSSIVRKDTGAAVQTQAPYRMNYQVNMEVRCNRTRGQQRLLDSLMSFLTNGPSNEIGPFLKSHATDRRYRIWLQDEFVAISPDINLADIRIYRSTFIIQDVALDLKSALDKYAVQILKLGFSAIPSEEKQKALINGEPIPRSTEEIIEIKE